MQRGAGTGAAVQRVAQLPAQHPSTPTSQSALRVSSFWAPERTNYPLTLSVDDVGEDFVLTAQVQSPVEPQRVCGFMQTVLEQLADALSRRLEAGACAGRAFGAERDARAGGVECDEAPYPADGCVHELVEEQVRVRPMLLRWCAEIEQLSYARAQCAGEPFGALSARSGVEAGCARGACAGAQRGDGGGGTGAAERPVLPYVPLDRTRP